MTSTYTQLDPPFVHVTGALWVGVFIEHQGYSSSSYVTVHSVFVHSLDGSTKSISCTQCLYSVLSQSSINSTVVMDVFLCHS